MQATLKDRQKFEDRSHGHQPLVAQVNGHRIGQVGGGIPDLARVVEFRRPERPCQGRVLPATSRIPGMSSAASSGRSSA
jgi:hypothetical protein